MAEAGFPGQHTTTTTVSPNITVQTSIRFDSGYVRTLPGILKVAQVSLNLLGFICISSSVSSHTRGAYFNTVAMMGFWVSGILLVFYIFHIIEKFYKIPWLQAEMLFCGVWSFLYLVGASLAAAFPDNAYAAAAFFGFCAMVAYGADAFVKFQAVRAGEIGQGVRVVNKQTTVTVSTPEQY